MPEDEDWLPGTVMSSLLALESPPPTPLELEPETVSLPEACEPVEAESPAVVDEPAVSALDDEEVALDDDDDAALPAADEDVEPVDVLDEPAAVDELPAVDDVADDLDDDDVEPSHDGSEQLPRSSPLSADRMATHESTSHSLSMLPPAVAAVGSDVTLKPVATVQSARLLSTVVTMPESETLVAITDGSHALSAWTTDATRAARANTVE